MGTNKQEGDPWMKVCLGAKKIVKLYKGSGPTHPAPFIEKNIEEQWLIVTLTMCQYLAFNNVSNFVHNVRNDNVYNIYQILQVSAYSNHALAR